MLKASQAFVIPALFILEDLPSLCARGGCLNPLLHKTLFVPISFATGNLKPVPRQLVSGIEDIDHNVSFQKIPQSSGYHDHAGKSWVQPIRLVVGGMKIQKKR